MRKRHAVIGLAAVLALSLAIPAFGGPSNPVANVAKSVKKTANKALKTANKAKKKANAASSTANANSTKLSCPPATAYVLGGCLETTLRAPLAFFGPTGADHACTVEGKRLPSIAERQQAHVNGKLPVGASEWTNSPEGGPASIWASEGMRSGVSPLRARSLVVSGSNGPIGGN